MKITPFLSILLLFSLHIVAQNPIVPQPQNISYHGTPYILSDQSGFEINGNVNNQTLWAVQRLKEGLRYRTGIAFDKKISIKRPIQHGFFIDAEKSITLRPGMDESYTINISNKGAEIIANTSVGTLRAVETLLQMVTFKDSLWVIPGAEISDKPEFAYRGLMIDAARHFMPIDVLKRNIRAMAAVKLNVLHLHLSDDQGWRLESKRYPSLHIMASDGYYYTQAQITDLINFASQRGILIIPEIDIPGHATAILTAKPTLASQENDYQIERQFGIMKPVLDPSKKETYTFLSNLFHEIDSLFPGPYIHIGGDEVLSDHWEENAAIDAFRIQKGLKDFKALQNYFINRVADSIRLTGKTIIGWQEIYGDGLKKDAIIQCWKNKPSAYAFAKQGYQTILSKGFYLDLLHPLKTHYNYDLIDTDAKLTTEQRGNFLGAEACMWSELVDGTTIDSRVWPRMALIAERFWTLEKRDRRSLPSATLAINTQLAEHGLTHLSAPYGILYEIAGNRNITPLIELQGLVTPLKNYSRHQSGKHNTLTPLNNFADAANPDPNNLDLFYNALREFIIVGANEDNFDFVAQKLFEWETFYEDNKNYFEQNAKLKELIPLVKNLSAAAKVANEAMEYIVRGKIPKDEWINNAKTVMKEAKQPVAEVELSIIDQLEKIIVFSKEHDVIVF